MNDVSVAFSFKDRKITGIRPSRVGPMTSKEVLQTHQKVTRDIGYYGQGLERIE